MPRAQEFDELRTHAVSARQFGPLLRFMTDALRASKCIPLVETPASELPFRITFEVPSGQRMGIVAYAFPSKPCRTKSRILGKQAFQVKYGLVDKKPYTFWQDPFARYITLLLGIDLERGIFVGADPVHHDEATLPLIINYTQDQIEEIVRTGWATWERDRASEDDRVDVLVGGRREAFLRYILFEREALREDQGHRQLLAERFAPNR